jgi:pimeloyl-ACP methyl ester carboxylesterase
MHLLCYAKRPTDTLAALIAMLTPQARLHVMKGGGHLVLLDSAEQVGPVITSFLRGDGS